MNHLAPGASIPPTTKALFPQLSPFPSLPHSPLSPPFPLPLVLPFIPLLPQSGPLETI